MSWTPGSESIPYRQVCASLYSCDQLKQICSPVLPVGVNIADDLSAGSHRVANSKLERSAKTLLPLGRLNYRRTCRCGQGRCVV
jgi:hypothetical protein